MTLSTVARRTSTSDKLISLVCLLSIVLNGGAGWTQAPPLAAGVTFTVLLQEIEKLVKTIESSARALMEQGNTSLAQQQLLLAATLENTGKNIKDAYQSSLQKTYDDLSSQEKTVYDHLKDLANSLENIEQQTNADISDRIYQTQTAANQILDRLPFTKRAPFLAGTKVKGFLDSRDQNDADVSVLGYLLADPRLNYKKPEVKIDGQVVPDKFVGAFYDRINIQIPDDLKEKIRFSNPPCAPRKTFRIELTTHYKKPLFGFFSYGFDTSVPFSVNSVSGRVAYDVRVVASGIRIFNVPELAAFSNRSSYISVGCEDAASTTVSWRAPSEANQLNGSGRWVDTANLKQQSASAIPNGTTIVAQGTIVGLDKEGVVVKNCPGGGHGTLEVFGTYYQNKEHREQFSYPIVSTLVSEPVHCTLPDELSLPATTAKIIRSPSWPSLLEAVHMLSVNVSGATLLNDTLASILVANPPIVGAIENAPFFLKVDNDENAPNATLDFRTINITITRKDCDQVLDTIRINVPADHNEHVVATSTNGLFKASLQKSSLTVEKIRDAPL